MEIGFYGRLGAFMCPKAELSPTHTDASINHSESLVASPGLIHPAQKGICGQYGSTHTC